MKAILGSYKVPSKSLTWTTRGNYCCVQVLVRL